MSLAFVLGVAGGAVVLCVLLCALCSRWRRKANREQIKGAQHEVRDANFFSRITRSNRIAPEHALGPSDSDTTGGEAGVLHPPEFVTRVDPRGVELLGGVERFTTQGLLLRRRPSSSDEASVLAAVQQPTHTRTSIVTSLPHAAEASLAGGMRFRLSADESSADEISGRDELTSSELASVRTAARLPGPSRDNRRSSAKYLVGDERGTTPSDSSEAVTPVTRSDARLESFLACDNDYGAASSVMQDRAPAVGSRFPAPARGSAAPSRGTSNPLNPRSKKAPVKIAPLSPSLLSADDGVWAAGSGTINGNGASGEYGSWGVGNQNGADTACDNVYAGSTSSYTTYSTVKNYMYVSGATHGSATTPSPSRPPTPSPTAANQVTAATLFVVTTASACAEYLGFGGGASWSGDSAYLCVDCDTSAHDTWTQVRGTTRARAARVAVRRCGCQRELQNERTSKR